MDLFGMQIGPEKGTAAHRDLARTLLQLQARQPMNHWAQGIGNMALAFASGNADESFQAAEKDRTEAERAQKLAQARAAIGALGSGLTDEQFDAVAPAIADDPLGGLRDLMAFGYDQSQERRTQEKHEYDINKPYYSPRQSGGGGGGGGGGNRAPSGGDYKTAQALLATMVSGAMDANGPGGAEITAEERAQIKDAREMMTYYTGVKGDYSQIPEEERPGAARVQLKTAESADNAADNRAQLERTLLGNDSREGIAAARLAASQELKNSELAIRGANSNTSRMNAFAAAEGAVTNAMKVLMDQDIRMTPAEARQVVLTENPGLADALKAGPTLPQAQPQGSVAATPVPTGPTLPGGWVIDESPIQ